tara:strand:+ start:16961 stop:17128 length:168 start_codon:yes stop_codon:yes gene_type:complete
MNFIYKIYNRLRVFFGFKRKLRGTWKVETIQELEYTYGMDVEEELVKILTKEMEK